ncbi:MAG: hypothetical protein ACYDHY_07875 [Acidiferrobacterales bacterium]
MTEPNALEHVYEPKRPSYRQIVRIPWLDSYKVKSMKSLPGGVLKITTYETLDQVTDPVLQGNRGSHSRLTRTGKVWEQRDFTFESYEICPFDLWTTARMGTQN